jgi:ferritin
MIKPQIAEQINQQINREFFSAYFYLDMSAAAENTGFKGIAAWFQAKYLEENTHAMKMHRYLLDHGAAVVLAAIADPSGNYEGPLDMFEQTLKHEQGVTASINELVDAAMTEKDHATYIFLQWFVTEQTEEEATVGDIIAQLKLVGERGEGLYMIDKELGGLAVSMNASLENPAA